MDIDNEFIIYKPIYLFSVWPDTLINLNKHQRKSQVIL